MTNDEPKCNSCGKPWRDHAGCESLCAEIARLRAAMPSPELLRNAAARLDEAPYFGLSKRLRSAAARIEEVSK